MTAASETPPNDGPPAGAPLAIELRGIDKRFGAVHANRDINLKVRKQSIHGIVGENGAGKSTLMSILYGFYEADAGDIFVSGNTVSIRSSNDAIAKGIGMVHQHFMLVDSFTVIENVMLGAEGAATLQAGREKVRRDLKNLSDEYGLTVDPDAIVSELSVGLQQRVEILKALYRGADILILDEPTGVLTPEEADNLFRILRQLRDQGKTILLITHKLREIMAVTDEVSVMRRGAMVATLQTANTSPSEIAEQMVGRRVLLEVDKGPAKPTEDALVVENLTVRDRFGVDRVKNVSFTVRRGEIVGLAGVSGNGQSELLEAISGIEAPASGRVLVNGKPLSHTGDPAEARELGMGHVPEDRLRMGLVKTFEENENSVLGYHNAEGIGGKVVIDVDAVRNHAKAHIEKYDIRPPNCRLKTANFSGGNQQKIVIAREMEEDPDVLLVGQPTRGVDIGAIEFIHKRLIEMRDAGKAVLLVSVELDEIFGLSDRILVMCGGEIVGERLPDQTDENEIGLMMAGIDEAADKAAQQTEAAQ
ncbi:MAG: ABC transporter ATP-binding protein [Devosiaceae bacterium]|nr:ABC transporter ATP-binding protein [Devosiaceae bacterium MH13]